MSMKRINPDKMSKAQLDSLGAEARKVTFQNTRPLSAESRRALARAANKGGRPRIGAGAKRIDVTVEKTLLSKADAYARKHGLSRAAVVAEGLKRIVAA
jgi:hypothetical protein